MSEIPIFPETNSATLIENIAQIDTASTQSTWRTVWEQGKQDLAKTSGSAKAAVFGTMALYGYEIGPGGNETVAPLLMGEVAKYTHSIFPGSFAVGAVTGAFIAAEQYVGGRLTIKSTQSFPNMSKTVFERLKHNSPEKDEVRFKPYRDLTIGKKITYALMGGTAYTVNREVFAVGETDTTKLNKLNKLSTMITSASIGILAGGVDIVDKTTTNSYVQHITDTIKNPITWIGLLSTKIGIDYVRNRIKKNSSSVVEKQ